MIIAIDGPAGAGKSTIARRLAQQLGFLYLDTGAMYRALTLKALEQHIPFGDTAALVAMARSSRLELQQPEDQQSPLRVFLDGRQVTREIRQPLVSQYVSDLAKVSEVRQVMVGLQRALGQAGDAVLDGRDIGTVVFPDAEKKFYLDATLSERSRRRYDELRLAGQKITLEQVQQELHNRDTLDSTRSCGPLRRAEDAFYLDTTALGIDEVVARLMKEIHPPSG